MSPTSRCVPARRARSWCPTSLSTRATWATTATRWTGGTAGLRSSCGRGTGRSRRALKPGRSGLSKSWPTASRPETWKGHVPRRSHSRRSGTQSDRSPDCWVPRCTWRRAWALPRRRRCCWNRSEWVQRLPELCGTLRAAGAPEVARLLVAGTWAWMSNQLWSWVNTARTEVRQPQLEKLSSPLVRLLEVADDKPRNDIVAALGGYGDNILRCLMPALRSADTLPADERRAAGFDALARDCVERLGAVIARPLRDEDDWSIQWTGCGCDLCDTLGTFLSSRSPRIFEWPLATDGRRHVHVQIDSAGLPVRHQTRRQGRPYTLVLTKTSELFTRENDTRHRAVTDLAWLTSAWGSAG